MLKPERYAEYAASPAAFRRDLLIDRSGKTVPLGSVIDPWQENDFAAMDAAWLHAVGRKTAPPEQPLRAFILRGRGHSKTTDQAVMNLWALCFARRPVRGIAGSGDRDQARLLRDQILVLTRLNPWLGKLVTVDKFEIKNVARVPNGKKEDDHPGLGSTLEILSNSAKTSWGHIFDFCTFDEVATLDDSGETFWSSLLSAAGKRANSLFVSISNSGWKEHWAYRFYESIRESKRWYCSSLAGPVATWMDPDELAEQERTLSPSLWRRVWLNEWVDGHSGDALPADAIAAAICRTGPSERPIPGCLHVLALDLGWTRDACGLLVICIEKYRQKLILVNRRRWIPKDMVNQEIAFADVMSQIRLWRRQYGANVIVSDKWQSGAMLQQLASEGMTTFPIAPTAATKREEAQSLIESLEARRLELYPCGLTDDLRQATVMEKSGNLGGIRIELERNTRGHGDELAGCLCALPSLVHTMKETAMGAAPNWGSSMHRNSPNWGNEVEDDRGFGSSPYSNNSLLPSF